jgi:hypothetical protein
MSQEKVEIDEKNNVLIQVLQVDHSLKHPIGEPQETELEQTSSFDSDNADDDARIPDGGLRAWLVVLGVRFLSLINLVITHFARLSLALCRREFVPFHGPPNSTVVLIDSQVRLRKCLGCA